MENVENNRLSTLNCSLSLFCQPFIDQPIHQQVNTSPSSVAIATSIINTKLFTLPLKSIRGKHLKRQHATYSTCICLRSSIETKCVCHFYFSMTVFYYWLLSNIHTQIYNKYKHNNDSTHHSFT
jgi:hypothetical protein